MNFLHMCNEKVTIEGHEGKRHENVAALLTDKSILVPDATIPIEPGDAILRSLPSGLVERYIVVNPGFHAQFRGMAAHYQVKYRREGTQPAGRPGYAIHVSGNNARVNIGSTDNSLNVVGLQPDELSRLAEELAELRRALLAGAQGPEHYAAIGQIASAEMAAQASDATGVSKALSALGAAGQWALDVAKQIAVPVATEAIKAQLGIPN